jgi:hypothetical protein
MTTVANSVSGYLSSSGCTQTGGLSLSREPDHTQCGEYRSVRHDQHPAPQCEPSYVCRATIRAIYRWENRTNEATNMLAEKFFLLIETIISRTNPDGSPVVITTSRHVPIILPSESEK